MSIIKKVFKTVVIVTVLSCSERFLGFIYRVFLSRELGSEGLGLYQIALSVLGLFMTITSSGIPITVSRTMIKNREEGKSRNNGMVVSSGILLTLIVSVPVTFLVLARLPVTDFLFSDKRCSELLSIVIPGLIITSVYAVIRGTFWGNERFLTYSLIELFEEIVMVAAGVVLVKFSTDFMNGAKRAMYAVLISYVFSFSASLTAYFTKGGRLSLPKSELKPLFVSSAPITFMRTATSLINTLIAVLLPARLIRYGMSEAAAVSEFGKVFGMAFPLIFMPSTFIGSLALVLVPELSSNYYSGNFLTLKNNVEKAVKFSVFTACLIIPVFLSAGEAIGSIIYADRAAGIYVKKGAITMLPMSITIITTSILNSLNKEKQSLLYYLSGATALVLSIVFLPKYLGVDSLILGMILSYSVTAVLNLRAVNKVCPKSPDTASYIVRAAAFVIPGCLAGYFANNLFLPGAGEFFAAAISSVISLGVPLTLFYVFGMLDFDGKNQLAVRRERARFSTGKKAKRSA